MKVAYVDCFSGAGGDMIVASLVDAGADADALRKELATLGVGGYSLSIKNIEKRGFAASRFQVELEQKPQPQHHQANIKKIIDASAISDFVQEKAVRVSGQLAGGLGCW